MNQKIVAVYGSSNAQVDSVVQRIHKELKYTIAEGYLEQWVEPKVVTAKGPIAILSNKVNINMVTKQFLEAIQKVQNKVTHQIIIPNTDLEFIKPEILLQGSFQLLDTSKTKTIVLVNKSKDDNWRMITELLTDILVAEGLGFTAEEIMSGLKAFSKNLRHE